MYQIFLEKLNFTGNITDLPSSSPFSLPASPPLAPTNPSHTRLALKNTHTHIRRQTPEQAQSEAAQNVSLTQNNRWR